MEPVTSLKRTYGDNLDQCIFCQSIRRNENLREASSQGQQTVKNACLKRKQVRDSHNIEIIERLERCFQTDLNQSLVWHKSCYTLFTDKNKIQRLHAGSVFETNCKFPVPTCTPLSPSLRKAAQPVKWDLCIFCQKEKSKIAIRSVMTKGLNNQIINSPD